MKKTYDFSKAQKGRFFRPGEEKEILINYNATKLLSKFEVYKKNDGTFSYRLKAENGEILAKGSGYKTKAACLNAIRSLRENTIMAQTVEL